MEDHKLLLTDILLDIKGSKIATLHYMLFTLSKALHYFPLNIEDNDFFLLIANELGLNLKKIL